MSDPRQLAESDVATADARAAVRTVITFGTFDLVHIGHLRILQRARNLGDRLVVGVSTDALNFSKKQRYPVYSENERRDLIAALRCVDEVFFEESLEQKRDYIRKYRADVLVMGDDWQGRFDSMADTGVKVVYLPRTPSTSTTEIIERIRST